MPMALLTLLRSPIRVNLQQAHRSEEQILDRAGVSAPTAACFPALVRGRHAD